MMAPYTTIVIAHFLNELIGDITAKVTAEVRRDLGVERDE